MKIAAIPAGPLETNCYLVVCPETQKAAVIDPAPESAPLIFKLLEENNLTLDKILLTHSHWDHIADTSLLLENSEVPVYIHAADEDNLKFPGADGLPCWIPMKGVNPTHLIKEGDVIEIGKEKLHVIETPGHTPGGVCFYSPENHILFSGDTLFQGSIGNLSFTTGRPELMWKSLKKLAKLPPETKVYPGHGYSTTIGQEPWLEQAEDHFS